MKSNSHKIVGITLSVQYMSVVLTFLSVTDTVLGSSLF